MKSYKVRVPKSYPLSYRHINGVGKINREETAEAELSPEQVKSLKNKGLKVTEIKATAPTAAPDEMEV